MPNWYGSKLIPYLTDGTKTSSWLNGASLTPQGFPMPWVPGLIWIHTLRASAVLIWIFNSNIHVDIKFQHHWPTDDFNLFSCSDSVVAQDFLIYPWTRMPTLLWGSLSSAMLRAAGCSAVVHSSHWSVVALFEGYQQELSWPESASILILPGICSATFGRVLLSWMHRKLSEPALHKGKIPKCVVQLFSHVSVLHESWELLPSIEASCCKFSGSCKIARNPIFFHFSHYKYESEMFSFTSNLICICCSLFSKIYYVLLGS